MSDEKKTIISADFLAKVGSGEIPMPGFVTYKGYTRELALDSVGPGWAGLINRFFDYLDTYPNPIKVVQVKEKYGGLRIYTDGYYEEVDDFLEKLEIESFSICEDCGKEGKLRKGSWYRTLCEDHAEGRPAMEPF